MRQIIIGALLAVTSLTAGAEAPTDRTKPAVDHLVLITVDGLRPDAVSAARAARLQALIDKSAYSAAGRTVGSPETLPSHVSMVTGLAPESHGVTWNRDLDRSLVLPSVFSRVQEGGGPTALLFGKAKMIMLAGPNGPTVSHGPGQENRNWERGADAALAKRFAAEFRRAPPVFTLIQLRAPDFAGHRAGWMSKQYLAAVRQSDAAIGAIIDAIGKAGLADRTAVLLTADHGGEGTRHVSGSEPSETIPWLCHVPGVKPGRIDAPVRTVDVAPTALALLGLTPLEGIDGSVVKDCLP